MKTTSRAMTSSADAGGRRGRSWRRLFSWFAKSKDDDDDDDEQVRSACLESSLAKSDSDVSMRDDVTKGQQQQQPSDDVSDAPPSWYVVEPVSYVESLSGEEQHVSAPVSQSVSQSLHRDTIMKPPADTSLLL